MKTEIVVHTIIANIVAGLAVIFINEKDMNYE
jgi:hypothetical protein